MDWKKFGNRLRDARKGKGITSELLGEQIGKTGNYVRQIECGARKPSLNMLISICDTLHVSPNELLQDLTCASPEGKTSGAEGILSDVIVQINRAKRIIAEGQAHAEKHS